MTGNTVHEAFLKVGHKQYVLYEFISASVEGGAENTGECVHSKGERQHMEH